MDRLFLDANVLFSAAYRSDAGVRRLWQLSGAELVTSAYAAEEARRNLSSAQQADLEALLDEVEVLTEAPLNRSIDGVQDLPDKDRPIFLAAIQAKATHLVTGDSTHFGRYFGRTVERVLIVTPGTYLRGRCSHS